MHFFKKIIAAACFIMACTQLTGCGSAAESAEVIESTGESDSSRKAAVSDDSEDTDITGQGGDSKADSDSDGSAASARKYIEKNATDEFFAGNTTDVDGFLEWVEETYGKKLILQISENGVLDDDSVWLNTTGRTVKTLFWDYHSSKKDDFFRENQVEEIETEDPGKTVFLFSGDLTLAENTYTTDMMDKKPNSISSCFNQRLMKTMRGADFFTINNEFCYADEKTGQRLKGKAFCFRASPKRAELLERIGADLVSLANNHVYDFGEDAFLSTLNTLDRYHIPYVGAGKNLKEAKKAYYVIAGGCTTAILAGTQIERSTSYTKAATADSAGVMKCLYPEEFIDAIKTAKKYADTVIVICHWGTEGTNYYGSDQVSLAEQFAGAGADAVIGGHTHTLQAVEYIDSVPVFYSLGNFYFSTTENMPRPYDTGLAEIVVSNDGSVKSCFIPCRFEKGKTQQLKKGSKDYLRIIEEMNLWSDKAVIGKDGTVEEKSDQ